MAHKAPGKSDREGLTMVQLCDMFPDENSARQWFESRVWPAGRYCPACGSTSTHEAGHNHMPYQPVEKGVIDRVSRHGEAYRGEGGFAILGDDEDDLNDQDGSSGRNKHEQGANSARHGLLRGAGADELAHQQ